MNKLSRAKRTQVISALVEGNSIRATVRMTGVAKNTITKLLAQLGQVCSEYQDEVMRDLKCRRIQCDEIWSFCYSKEKNVPEEYQGKAGYGDVWTWVAIDADTKLVPCYLVGERSFLDAYVFIDDLAGRLANRVQLTTDGLRAYLTAVDGVFGSDIDYAMLHKVYRKDRSTEATYSPAACIGIEKMILQGDPNPVHISTSFVERQNLTMRMGMRRFTRLTNGFSRKLENHAAAVSLHFMHYNFARPHKSLANPYAGTPAMAAGITDHVWSVEEIVALLEQDEARQRKAS